MKIALIDTLFTTLALLAPAGAHVGNEVLVPKVPDPAAMVIDGRDDDWSWYDPRFAATMADMEVTGSGYGHRMPLPGIFVDPSDYDFTYRLAWIPGPRPHRAGEAGWEASTADSDSTVRPALSISKEHIYGMRMALYD